MLRIGPLPQLLRGGPLRWRSRLSAALPASRRLGPHGVGMRADGSSWRVHGRPQQGRLGDCWLMAPMLAIHETAPERLRAMIRPGADGMVEVRLPGLESPIRVDRRMPADAQGRFVGARVSRRPPGWAGILEKAVAQHVSGGYGTLRRGIARYGFAILTGCAARTVLPVPSCARIHQWALEGRAMCASTHPLSGRVQGPVGPLPPNHVMALLEADVERQIVLLRDQNHPERLLEVPFRVFRRGFLSVDVTAPLR